MKKIITYVLLSGVLYAHGQEQGPSNDPRVKNMAPEKIVPVPTTLSSSRLTRTPQIVPKVQGNISNVEEMQQKSVQIQRETALGDAPMPNFGKSSEDSERKRKEIKAFCQEAVQYLKTHDDDQACAAFTHGKQWSRGELYVFVFDERGICLAHGLEPNLIWQDMYNYRDSYDNPFVQIVINKCKQGGGYISYEWRNATKETYVEGVIKEGKLYSIGCGFYPHSKADSAVSLVKGAVVHFEDVISKGGSPESAFSDFSYPLGVFLMGDLYLYALDFDGRIYAQGDRPRLIGQNALDYRDADGKQPNKVIIDKLRNTEYGIWVEYKSKNAVKYTYAHKVADATGKEYFIAAGFYPAANRDAAVELAHRGAQYLAKQGLSVAAREFSDIRGAEFLYGDLSLFIYDFKGVCLANGKNNELIGQNQYDEKDPDGRYFVREFISKAEDGGGWVDYKDDNIYKSVYVELVEVGQDKYVVGCGLYPVSKREEAILLVKSAVGTLKSSKTRDAAFRQFSNTKGKYVRGDLQIFVYTNKGICLVDGDNSDIVWRNRLNVKDDGGKMFIKEFIDVAERGPDWVPYKVEGAKLAYVEQLEKDGEIYIVGCSFFA